jgi:hypothetical protein
LDLGRYVAFLIRTDKKSYWGFDFWRAISPRLCSVKS